MLEGNDGIRIAMYQKERWIVLRYIVNWGSVAKGPIFDGRRARYRRSGGNHHPQEISLCWIANRDVQEIGIRLKGHNTLKFRAFAIDRIRIAGITRAIHRS